MAAVAASVVSDSADRPGITALSWGKHCGSPIKRLPPDPTRLSFKSCGRDADPRGCYPMIGGGCADDLAAPARHTRGDRAGGLEGRPFLLIAEPRNRRSNLSRQRNPRSQRVRAMPINSGYRAAKRTRSKPAQARDATDPMRAAADNKEPGFCCRGAATDLTTTCGGEVETKTLATKSEVSLRKPIDAHNGP